MKQLHARHVHKSRKNRTLFFLIGMMGLSCAFISVFFLSCDTGSDETGLVRVQRAIDEAGAHWQASENWVTNLSPMEYRALIGPANYNNDPQSNVKSPTEKEKRDFNPKLNADFPESFSWQSKDGYDWNPLVRNQGACGSCWAFAAVGAMEMTIKIANNTPTANMNFSEQHLVACDSNSNGCGGGQTYHAFNYIYNNGIPWEDCFPYRAKDLPCSDTCADWQSQAIGINGYYEVGKYVNDIKEEVMMRPVAVSMQVYNDFNYYNTGVYEHVTGGYEGNHAVIIIGWDDNPDDAPGVGCWIVRNSWGKNWGENGYFRIKYYDSNLGSISNWVCTYFGDQEAPPPPTGVRAVNQYSQGAVGSHLRQITVSWNEVPQGTTYGFHVYTSLSGSSGDMQRITDSPVRENTFIDTTVPGDSEYVAFYGVKAVLISGKESEFSNIAQNQDM